MSDDVARLLFEGIVGGVVVVIGVVVAEFLTRRRERRERVQTLVQELGLLLPRLLVPFTNAKGGISPTSPEHLEIHQRVVSHLSEIRYKALHLRRAADIRREASRLSGKVTAAYLRWWQGKTISLDDVADISTEALRRAAIGDHENLDAMWRHFDKHGFNADETAPDIE